MNSEVAKKVLADQADTVRSKLSAQLMSAAKRSQIANEPTAMEEHFQEVVREIQVLEQRVLPRLGYQEQQTYLEQRADALLAVIGSID